MLTIQQAAQRACVAYNTVRYWLSAGKLTGHSDGRRVMIDSDELDSLIAERLAEPEAQTFPYVHVVRFESMVGQRDDLQNMVYGLLAYVEDLHKLHGMPDREGFWEDYKPGDLFNL